ncbi:MAG: polyprenol monophosphomannose synthase [Anaerolineales bacterium]
MSVHIVIPTYNEAENLADLCRALFRLPLNDVHLLIVDDNSPDGTGEIAETMKESYPGQLSVLHRAGKLGLGTAYISGFRKAMEDGADVIVQMDADFSHNPQKIPTLVEELETWDLAIGSRYVAGGSLDEGWAFWRKGLSYFGNLYARLILGMPVRDLTGGFRAWRKETLLGIPLDRVKSQGYAFQVEMAYITHRRGYQITEVPIYFADRERGTSKMSLQIQMEAALRVWAILFEYRDLGARG